MRNEGEHPFGRGARGVEASLRSFAPVPAAALTLIFTAASASAQLVAPSQVTPAELRPAPASSASIALPAAPGLIAPPGAANLSIQLGAVVVEGGFDDLKAQSDSITNGVVGRKVTVAQVYDAASALEAAYGAAGYTLVRVVVPPQKLDPHGALKLIVVDGYVESVDVAGVPERQRALVAARMAPLIGRRRVKLQEIERRVLLASDVPGLALRSTLTPGLQSGGAKLVLEGTDKLVSGSVGIDNNLPKSLGFWEYVVGLQLNDAFGQGEQIYFTETSGDNLDEWLGGRTPVQIVGGGFTLPIGLDGLVINPEYTNAQTRPQAPPDVPASQGYFQRADLRASYPLIRTRAETLTVSSTLEWDQEYLVAKGFGVDLYDDDYFVARGKVDSLTSLSGGAAVQATGELSQGLDGRAGSNSLVPLSQQGASPEFTKLAGTARWTQPLAQAFSVAIVGEGQTSFGRPLMISEQFALDGPSAVSGFPTGEFMVDEGALARAELGRSVNLTLSGSSLGLEPYLFGAGGAGVVDQPTAVQLGTLQVGSIGVGARTTFGAEKIPVGAALGVELARYYSSLPLDRQGWRSNLSFSIRF